MNTSTPIVDVKQLTVDFATGGGNTVRAVAGVDLSLKPGETLALLGESGSGKSVTLRALMRLHPKSARFGGSVTVDGRDILAMSSADLARYRGKIVSMIFQDPGLALDPVYRVGDQIAEAVVRHETISHADARKRALELFMRVRIPSPERRLDNYPHEMSGGMRQRAMIALALACRPKVLLADEPTTALDATVQIQVLLLLRELQRELGLAVIFVTHDIGVAVEVADRVAVMYGPVVLAADLGPENKPAPRIPVLVDDNKPLTEWLEPVKGEPLAFRTKGAGRPDELILKPFYGIYEDRYAVYFDRFDEAGWQRLEAEYRAEEARLKDLEARTLDYMRIGEMQPERDHKLKQEKNDVREANGRSFRTPLAGGWFEFEMKVDGEKPNDLVMTYWGSDRNNPTFDILIDGQKLLTETLPERKPNVYFDTTRPIPEEMTKGKKTVIVRIQSIEGKSASAVAGARTVKRA